MNAGGILRPDVLVVGAGPVGGPLAVALHRKGHSVLLVEKQAKPQRVFKGEYIQPAATRTLRRLRFEKIFQKSSCESVHELRFRDLDADGKVISEILMSYPAGLPATSISHFDLVSAIRDHIREELGESAHFGAQLTPQNLDEPSFCNEPRFTLKNAGGEEVTVAPRWVIGCDGRNSSVRKWMGGEKLPQNAPVTLGAAPEMIVGAEIATAKPNPHRYEVFRFFQKGTLSSFSLGQLGQRLYLSHPDQSASGPEAGGAMASSAAATSKFCREGINTMLKEVSPMCELGEMEAHSPILSFPAYGMWFGPAHKGCFLLAGDASCVTSPYGGQGINAGMEHVEALLENFKFELGLSLEGKQMAEAYALEVRRSFNRISLLNFGLYYLFFARSPIFKKVSSYILRVWENNGDFKVRVMRLFAGLDRDQPSVSELIQLWGLSWTPRRLTWAQVRLSLRSLGVLLEHDQ